MSRQNLTRILIFLSLGIPFLLIFFPFFVPMLLAVFFAFGLEPFWKKIKLRRQQKKFFPFILLLFWILFLFTPLVVIGFKIVRLLQSFKNDGTQNSQLFQSLSTLWDKLHVWTVDILGIFNLDTEILPGKDEVVAKISPFIVTATTNFLGSLPELGLSLLVFFGMLVVLVPRADQIRNFFVGIQILPTDELDDLVACLKRNCNKVLVSTFLIGIIQAAIVATGASIFGFHEFFLIFVITFVLSFIPVIGAAPVSFVLAVTAFILGQSGQGIGLIVVTVIAGSIDNIIKPYVFSGSDEGTHPIIALIGILGAIAIFGLPGLLLGPLLLQVGVELLPKILSKVVEAFKA